MSSDARRREFTFNVIIAGFIILAFFLGSCMSTSIIFEGSSPHGLHLFVLTLCIPALAGLLALSRKGHFMLASYLFITLLLAANTYGIIIFGAELPFCAICYITTIIIASILISTRFGFFTTIFISAVMIVVAHLEISHALLPSLDWKTEDLLIYDPLELSGFFFLIMGVSWLSNRDMEDALRRAKKSEVELKVERDNLEITIEERTREIKNLQADKMAQLYRSAELGKLSTGIFHDLMNPLTTVVSSIGELERHPEHLPEVKAYLEKAVRASRRLGGLLGTVRKQITARSMEETFSLNKELREAVDILKYRSREIGATLVISEKKELFVFGNPLKFHQVCVNLISNAIDACEAAKNSRGDFFGRASDISVSLSKIDKHARLKIADRGCGIPNGLHDKVFDSFFTTKDYTKGIGLGLSTTKHIIEKDFGGTISFSSVENQGTTFTVLIPLSR